MLNRVGASSPGRHRIGTVAILVVVGALVATVLWVVGGQRGWFADTDRQSGTGAGTVAAEQPPSRRVGLEETLTARARAMREKDPAGWQAVLDPADPTLHQAQGQIFDNMRDVEFDLVEYQYTGDALLSAERQAALGPEAWVAKVNISYRIAGADAASVRREQYVTMVQRGRDWFIAGFDDGPADAIAVSDLWDLGPVTVIRGDRSVLLASTDHPRNADLVSQVDRGAAVVDEVWGTGWPRTVVIVVPADQAGMAQVLGRNDQNGLTQIAAVTTGEVGLTHTGIGADRIVINPDTFDQLGGEADQLVLTHELAHVAARAGGGGEVPIWLSEGMADYVAFQDTDLSIWERAGAGLLRVRQGQVPAQLPTVGDFDPAQEPDVAPAYAVSYLAVDLLVQRYGQDRVLELYRTVQGTDTNGGPTAAAVPIEEAMPRVLGLDLEQFEQDWLNYLVEQSGR